jgi:hypothetical protein
VPRLKLTSAASPSGREEADEASDAKEEEDNDCAIDRAKPRLFGVVGRDERRIKNIALPAHVVCNPGHATIRASDGPTAIGS